MEKALATFRSLSWKFVVVEKGRLYLGRQVKDIGPKGLSHAEEVKGILAEMDEDLEYGVWSLNNPRFLTVSFLFLLAYRSPYRRSKFPLCCVGASLRRL